MLVLALYLALYFGIFGLLFSSLVCSPSSFVHRPSSLVVVPAVWVVLEYIRAHFLTGFGWAMLGYSQYKNIAFIQIADIAGVYAASFILMAVNLLVFFILKTKRPFFKKLEYRLKLETAIIAGCVILVFIYGSLKLNKADRELSFLKVAVIQGNIRQDLKWQESLRKDIFNKYLALSEKAEAEGPDLIIWPETSLPYWINENDYSSKQIIALLRQKISLPILLGCVFGSEDSFYNSALLLEGVKVSNYNKIHLVPFGEYIPLRRRLPILEWIVNNIVPIEDFSRGREFTVFNFKPRFSTLICFEDTIPELSRNFVRNGARMLVNITNDAWFGDTSSPFQHLQSSVFRAVENRVSVIRAANTGVSCFIDRNGKIDSFLKDALGKKTFVDAVGSDKVGYSNDNCLTIYTRFGDMFVFICLLLVIYVIITKIISEKIISQDA